MAQFVGRDAPDKDPEIGPCDTRYRGDTIEVHRRQHAAT